MSTGFINELANTIGSTLLDVLPIAAILIGFQVGVLRQTIPNLQRVLIGAVYVIVGLSFFLFGIKHALFPLGKAMARQLTDPAFIGAGIDAAQLTWHDYYWTYIF
ncbi:MAG: DUF1538 family protein, partial [Hyphomicrobiales bacterium]|nr:DUF1538 family protein [Hyphomicrobiales bacterium]